MNVRIYHVADPKAGTERLIRASSPAQAVRHAASHMRAHVAGQETIVELLSRGARVETAGDTPEDDTMRAIAADVRSIDETAGTPAEVWPHATDKRSA